MVPLTQQIAGGMANAHLATSNAMKWNPQVAQATTAMAGAPPATATTGQAIGYNAFTGMNPNGQAMPGFGASSASGGGYSAAQMGPVRDVMARQFADTNLDPYMNPYLSGVVDQTAADMERARLIEQNQADDAMQAAGAFGGSRHGIANAETNRGFYDRLGATLGQLRNMGFETARQSAFQDIANEMQADLANQGMDFNVGSFNADATNTARRTGANNSTQASIANANNSARLASDRVAAVNNARRFGADAANTMSMFNAGEENNTSRFNSQLGADLSRFNASEANANSRFNTTASNDFYQNQFDNQMRGAAQLANLSNLGFGMQNTVNSNLAADGAQAEALTQRIIDAAKGQFGGYTGAGQEQLETLIRALSAVPSGQTKNESSNPGLFGMVAPFL